MWCICILWKVILVRVCGCLCIGIGIVLISLRFAFLASENWWHILRDLFQFSFNPLSFDSFTSLYLFSVLCSICTLVTLYTLFSILPLLFSSIFHFLFLFNLLPFCQFVYIFFIDNFPLHLSIYTCSKVQRSPLVLYPVLMQFYLHYYLL